MLNFSIPTQKGELITPSINDRPAQCCDSNDTRSPGNVCGSRMGVASPGRPGTALATASKTAPRGHAAWRSRRPGGHRGPGDTPLGSCPWGYSEKPHAEGADLSPALPSQRREEKRTIEHELTPYLCFARFYHWFADNTVSILGQE